MNLITQLIPTMKVQLETRGRPSHHNERRPRSRCIAIPRRSRNTKAEEEIREMESAMYEYDWATWRLYNRLIQHRQRKQPFTLNDPTSFGGSEDPGDDNTTPLETELEQEKETSLPPPMYDEYGGIFELEL